MVLDGYPDGATVHGIDSPEAKELRRLAVFMGELQIVERWLSLIPSDAPQDTSDQTFVFAGLADAALLAFCRCFDLNHALRPLKKKMLSLEQRDELERLQSIRNKLVAHDDQLFNGVFSLIVRSADLTAIEAVSLNLLTPFVALPELKALRALTQFVLEWVKQEHWRVASEIVQAFDAMPAAYRAAAPPFTINVQSKDHFAPKKERRRQK
ncbi:hypothetical protein RZS28_18135 [Methylocapsa polymorpha]|uniref:Uncharacterized protein n=1 Tax=Methylocapsa polymorpha TaxID=3080828 RepID=A0ABZ0HSA4_9HYPH|nr:hypothetical protein RZS28_18135 [Methylocapsa sp. RX1]